MLQGWTLRTRFVELEHNKVAELWKGESRAELEVGGG